MIVNGLSQCPASTTVFTFGEDPIQLSWVNVDSEAMSISGTPAFTVSAERVALLYRSSDVTAATGASSTAGSGAAGANSGSGSSDSASNSGLSAGAVAGIAIGAAAIGILLVSGLFWLCLRRRKSSQVNRPAYGQAGDAHPHPAVSSHAPTGPMHELKATGTVSTPQVPAGNVAPNATELVGSTPSDPRWAGVPQHGRNPYHGGGTPVVEEVSTSNDYHQLSGTFERGQGVLDNSRQNTPVDLVGPGAGGRGYPPEKIG